MRTVFKLTTLSVAILLGACSKRQPETVVLSDDLQKDLASVGGSGDLATAPQSYQRMRFVSSVERSPSGAKTARPTPVRRRLHTAAMHHDTPPTDVASEPMVTAASPTAGTAAEESPAPAPTPEPAVTTAPAPAPEPSHAPAGSGSTVGSGDYGAGGAGAIGAVIGGIMGAVIRGGHVGVDKCDPRHDGRGGTVIDRGPVFGMPMPTGQPTFPGGGRRYFTR